MDWDISSYEGVRALKEDDVRERCGGGKSDKEKKKVEVLRVERIVEIDSE